MIFRSTPAWIVRTGTIAEAVDVSLQLPEFLNPHREAEYEARLSAARHLILVATTSEGIPIGMKVGYQRETDGSFYSWMGGVLPAYRSQGVAKALAEVQHSWAAEAGYRIVRFKTMNKHKAMLQFALRHGFYLIGVEPREDPRYSRIWLEKEL